MSRGKSPPRAYFPSDIAAHGICELPKETSHHLVHVLRLGAGDRIVLFDGENREYDATIERASKAHVTVKVAAARTADRESPLGVTLAQGISSGERMDYTIQKAVELGVHAIQPLMTERSVVRLDAARAAKRVAHWQAVVVSACEQCGRNRVPPVHPVTSLQGWLGALAPAQARLTLSPDASVRLAEVERPQSSIVLLVGPEGGLAPAEQRDARASGFEPVRIGPRVLRTETAAVAALAAMQTLWGDF
jgi:16S rRNA (uracil1498-N3)-methyltransferase